MALKPVTDPSVLTALRSPVTDPALLAALNAPEQPPAELSPSDRVPMPGDTSSGFRQQEENPDALDEGGRFGDPVVSMWTDGLKKLLLGGPEAAAGMLTNAGVAGVAGLTAPFVAGDADDQAGYIRDFTEQHSYVPRGENARQLMSGVSEAFQPVENIKHGLGDTIMESTGSPGAATAGYMLPDLAAIIAGPKMGGKGPTVDLRKPGSDLSGGAPPRQKPTSRPNPSDPVATARSAGVKLLPSDIERVTLQKPPLSQRIAEAIAPEDIRRDFTIDNQKKVNQLAREKVKAPEGTVLDETGIDNLREPHYQTYRDVEAAVEVVPPSEEYLFALDDATLRAQFPKGTKPTVTEVISSLRTKARKKQNNPNADSKIEQDGQLDREAADALEAALGKRLEELGDGEALTRYQEARKSLAELNDVDEAQQGGIVDAGKLHRKDDKAQKRITGQTKMAADIAERFPDSVKSSLSPAGRKGAPNIPVSREGIVKKGAKAAARGVAKVTGLGDRLLVDSEGFQNRLGKPATDAERSYFEEYGRQPTKEAPPAAKPPGGIPKTNVMPPQKRGLGDELALLDDVENPDVLPDVPDRLTADTAPRSRGDIEPEFDVQLEAEKLAGEMGLDKPVPRDPDSIDYVPPSLADQIAGEQKLARPRDMEQLDLKAGGEPSSRLQLTPSPKGGQKVTAARDKSGNVTVRHEEGGEITAIELPDQGVLQIKDSKVPVGERGQGRGQAMARQLLAVAKKKGLRLVSDNKVSESAQAMWAALKKKGLNVKQNPATRQASGELVSKSELKPVFEIVDDLVTE